MANDKSSKQSQNPQKKANSLKRIEHSGELYRRLSRSRPAMMIISLVIAIVLWFVISIVIYPTTLRTIYHVPLEVDLTGTAAEEDGLSVIDYDVEEVSVQLEGNRKQVGNIEVEDLVATAAAESVTSAGTKKLSIRVTSADNTEFEVKSITPSNVSMTFDYIDTYTFDIQPSAPNITFVEGCILDEENFISTPATIEVTGPQQELEQVAYCVAETEQKEQLSVSKILTTDTLLFYNEQGTQLDNTNFTYELARFSLEIPVLYQKTMDITYQITNVPTGFDLDCLDLTLSESEITLAVPSSAIDEMSEFNIGSIALRDIDLDYSQDFVVSVPEEYTNQSGFSTITLTLNADGLAKKDFILSDIGVVNAPASYDFEVLTQQLTVSIIGPEDVLEDLDASDITVNVDLLSYSVQADAVDEDLVTFYYMPTISCSKYDNVWAVGDYRVAVQGMRTGATTTTEEESTTETKTTAAETDEES
ncbi:MAG: hypothetical protein LUC50_05355 [Ruminococcus sp.]|nr:hypothetical protein [Ruminococcus sp.]